MEGATYQSDLNTWQNSTNNAIPRMNDPPDSYRTLRRSNLKGWHLRNAVTWHGAAGAVFGLFRSGRGTWPRKQCERWSRRNQTNSRGSTSDCIRERCKPTPWNRSASTPTVLWRWDFFAMKWFVVVVVCCWCRCFSLALIMSLFVISLGLVSVDEWLQCLWSGSISQYSRICFRSIINNRITE